MPFLSLCQLREKFARSLLTVWPTGGDNEKAPANELKTGLLGGLLSGYCGYYLEISNTNGAQSQEITIYKSSSEFYNSSSRIHFNALTLIGLATLIMSSI